MIKKLSQKKRDAINNNTDLTPSQKAHALADIDKTEKDALQHIEILIQLMISITIKACI